MSDYQQEREMGWDDVFESDGEEFVLAPEGDYEFDVTYLKKTRHEPKNGKGKLPPCPKAEVSLRIFVNGNEVTIKHNLFLHTKCEWSVSAFFRAIGMKKHGEPLRPKWDEVVGSRGRCKIGVRTWSGKDGSQKQSNEVSKFYDFDAGRMSSADTSFDPDAF